MGLLEEEELEEN